MRLLIFTMVILSTENAISKSRFPDPSWEDILSTDELQISPDRTKRFIASNTTQANADYQTCMMPNAKQSRCNHVQHCILEDFKTDIMKYMESLCAMKHTSLGASCPDVLNPGTEALAGKLPAITSKNESQVMPKVARAENRGCGLSTQPMSRVASEHPESSRDWPWMASITPPKLYQYCGGTLITDRHVLTAAHCTRKWRPRDLLVRLGEYDLKRINDSRAYNFSVVEIKQHEAYDMSNYKNDIAILKLHRAAVFNTYVWPMCLPPPDLELMNEMAIVIGWGSKYYRGPHSDVLMEVPVLIWEHDKCEESFAATIFEENYCAGGPVRGQDSCQGDSGGPLMYQMPSGRWVVVGIVSWGMRCGEPEHPGIYTRVDKYLPWIIQNVNF